MTILEMIEKRSELLKSIKERVITGQTETRMLTEEEDSEHKKMLEEIRGLDVKIKEAKAADLEERSLKTPIEVKNEESKMKNKRFNLTQMIVDSINNREMDEPTKALIRKGEELNAIAGQSNGDLSIPVTRAVIQAKDGADAGGGYVIEEDQLDVLGGLYSRMVAAQAGATIYTGLKHNQSIPVYSGQSAGTVQEVSSSADGAGTWGEVTLQPRRASTYLEVSKRFLLQTDGMEDFLKDQILDALADDIEGNIWGNHATSTTNLKSDGMFTGYETGSSSITGSASWAKLNRMEKELDDSKALGGKVAFFTNPGGRYSLKTTPKAASTDSVMLWEGSANSAEVNGYPAYVTQHIDSQNYSAGNGVVLCNIKDLLIGYFGALNITVDPYTEVKSGKIVIAADLFYDFAHAREASFVTGSFTA